ADLFRPWTEGEYAEVFSDKDSLELKNNICGLELNRLMEHKEAVVPVFAYLLHRICGVLDGKPAIIVVDEAWDMLDNPFFAPRLSGLLDELRQKNAMMVFATDHADRILKSPINPLLTEKIATQIFLPDSDADETYAAAFKLSNTEISYIAVMNV